MAFDAGMTASAAFELNSRLPGAKVEKIYQPERDEVDFLLRRAGETMLLACSASSGAPRVHITEISRENPKVPPTFCTLLRKYLSGARATGARQLDFERAIEIEFDAWDEMGFEAKKYLICELMGKFGNLILLDEGRKILGVLKVVDFTVSAKRQLIPGMKYEMPPAQEKKNPLEENIEGFYKALESAPSEKSADKFIVSEYLGISPLIAREIVYRAAGNTDSIVGELSREKLWAEFEHVINIIRRNDYVPTMILQDGKPFEYSFTDILQYGNAEKASFKGAGALLDAYFGERERLEHIRQRSQDIHKLISAAETRLAKKTQLQEKELDDCAEKEEYKKKGDLISSNLYALKKGDSQVCLINYYSEDLEEVAVTLDRRLTPSQNAQKWYKKFSKAKNAEVELKKQIAISREELQYIGSVYDALSRAAGQDDLDEMRRELWEAGFASKMKDYSPKKQQQPKPLVYTTSNGCRVLCGKNNIQNEYVTFKAADKSDWWFHVKGAPGSHTVLLCGNEEPPAEDFTEAAMIAAVNSKLSDGVMVPVDYTKVKNIKKPPAAKPGFVTYSTNYTAYVTPDAKLVQKMKKEK